MSDIKRIPNFGLLQPNHTGLLEFKDGSTTNYTVICLTENELKYYTGKGIREIWKPGASEEKQQRSFELKKIIGEENGKQKLIKSKHIAVIKLTEIARVID